MQIIRKIKNQIKKIRYLFEAVIFWVFMDFVKILKVDFAANFCAKIAKFIGPKIKVHKLAKNNIKNAISELKDDEIEKILENMWDNLGRIIGEFCFISRLEIEKLEEFVEISKESKENILSLKESGKGGIIFSGHIGNWELGPKVLEKFGLNVSTVYRPLNNPFVEEMTAKMRKTDMIGKNSAGNRKIIDVIKNGGFVIILADQKVTEGAPIKFFHQEAVTTTSIARIALKYQIPIIPARIIRIGNQFKFKAQIEKPLVIENKNNLDEDIKNITLQINKKLEIWIKEYPSQWFWVHNRWKK
jgi:KDO2-lipid IV(A) lauroyltransferase